jgi:hypothetical protein
MTLGSKAALRSVQTHIAEKLRMFRRNYVGRFSESGAGMNPGEFHQQIEILPKQTT